MKQLFIIILLAFCSACNKKTEEQTLLYNQLISYRDDLKMSVKSQEIYISETTQNSGFFRKRFDSLNKINNELDKSFELLRYGDRKKLLELRDNYNFKHKLNLKFDSVDNYENIPDSIFNRLIETDILKLRKRFQDAFMFRHGE